MKKNLLLFLSASTSLLAESGQLEIEIPRLDVAEYHRPYVAVWVQDAGNQHVMDIEVWYQQDKKSAKEGQGTKWLKDIRKWWRMSGRELDFPVDGLSNPTKPPGKHSILLNEKLSKLPALEEGNYQLFVEAAREVGGREILSIPFKWDGKNLQVIEESTVKGSDEITSITLK